MKYSEPRMALPSPHETGKLKIKQLKRFWQATLLSRDSGIDAELQKEWQLNKMLLSALNLGLEQLMIYLYQTAPSFDAFEDWIIETAGILNSDAVQRFNQIFANENAETKPIDAILSAEDSLFF